MKARLGLVAVAGLSALGLVACGDSDDSSDDSSRSTTVVETVTDNAAAGTTTDAGTTTSAGTGSDGSLSSLLSTLNAPSSASKVATEDISEGGVQETYTTSESPSSVLSFYESELGSAGWSVQGSGGGGSDSDGGGGIEATMDSAYLVVEAGSGGGTTYVGVCIWSSEPSNTDCDEDDDEDESSDAS